MCNPGAVIHRRWLQIRECLRDRPTIQQINGVPQDSRVGSEVLAFAHMRPCGDRGLFFEEMIDEVAACETSGARDQRGTRHG